MAHADITVDDVLKRLSYIIEGTETASTAIRPSYIHALQAAFNELVSEGMPAAFRSETTFNTVDGTEDYTTPTDFKQLIEPSMRFTASPRWTLTYVPQQEYDRNNLETVYHTSSKSRPRIFTIIGKDKTDGLWQFRLRPVPDQAYSIKYRYLAWADQFTSDTDGTTVIDRRFPEEYKHGIWSGAIVRFFADRVSRDELATHAQAFEQVKQRMRTDEPITPVGYQRQPWGRNQRFDPLHRSRFSSELGTINPWG